MRIGQRILIVEDSDEDFYATSRVLRKFGSFPLERCTVGSEVLPHLQKDATVPQKIPLSLILLDLNLPGKRDGRQVLGDLKADHRYRSIPVVIMTTSSNPRDISRCYDQGASGYMVKPVDLERFTECIENLVKYWFDAVSLPENNEATA